MMRTLLAIGEWQQCGKLISSALGSGWSVLHTSLHEDVANALKQRKVDLILLAGCRSDPGWERTTWGIRATIGEAPLVVLGSDSSQDTLISALIGAISWSCSDAIDSSGDHGQGAPLSEGIAGGVHRALLTSTLSLLEPTHQPVTADMRRAMDFIEDHFAEPISLADAAKAACYSRCHFCKLFKQQLGLSFISYLSRVRIRHAADLLVRSDMSITQIAFEVGFNDLSHFERVFRTLRKQSPSRFRQAAKQLQGGQKNLPSPTLSLVTS